MGSNQSKVTGTAGGGPVLSAVDAEIKAHEGHAKGKKVLYFIGF
jgi:hypothetical protein